MLFTILLLRTSRKNGYKLWVQWRLGLFGWTSISYHWPMVFKATINQSLEYACPPKWSQKIVLPRACTHSRYSFWSSPLSDGHDAPCLTPVPPPPPPPHPLAFRIPEVSRVGRFAKVFSGETSQRRQPVRGSSLVYPLRQLPGGYSWEILVGVCQLVFQILTLFQTTKCPLPYPFSDLRRQQNDFLIKIHLEFAY